MNLPLGSGVELQRKIQREPAVPYPDLLARKEPPVQAEPGHGAEHRPSQAFCHRET
jgi:hypothetical protein